MKSMRPAIAEWLDNTGIDECSERVGVQRPPKTSELAKSVVAARADARDVVIQTQNRRDVDAEQTNMTAGNGSTVGEYGTLSQH